MQGVPYDVMVDGVSLVFSIAGLIWAVRFTGWPSDRYAPISAVILGVVLVAGYSVAPAVFGTLVRGIAAGTMAAGGYAGVKKMVTNNPNAPDTPFSPPVTPPTPSGPVNPSRPGARS